tara:strand:+ start:47 stop:562 length:516 start_codon:yes stop_codon:yes gene_type:complete
MIHLNVGSNLVSAFGSKIDNISIAIDLLINDNLKIKKISNFYETPSYPNKNFPKFLNVGILADFNYDYRVLFKKIKLIEKKLGRKKSQKNDPRIIDIDIIDFKGKISKSNKISLPHPRAHLRNFVLYPILEIDSKWSHPIFKKNAQYLINQLNQISRIEITRLKKNVNIKR